MVKKVYLWNDLNIFSKNIDVSLLDMEIQSICDNYDLVDYIDSTEVVKWKQKQNFQFNCSICLGTRPKLMFGSDKTLNISRVRNNDGKTIGFNDDNDLLWSKLLECKEICLYEDILVEGRTIQYICNKLNSLRYNGKLIVNIFCANQMSVNEILAVKYNFLLQIYAYKHMNGKPINQTTLFCIHDILYGSIGNKRYADHIDIFKSFLGSAAVEFVTQISNLEKEIKI